MERYRVVCTEQVPLSEPTTHAHIVAVGTGDDPDNATKRWTKAEVIEAITRRTVFYTVSPSTGKVAVVVVARCGVCAGVIIKTEADAVGDNNLDSLRRCRF